MIIIRATAKHLIKWLNSFPVKGRVSKSLSLMKILELKIVHFGRDFQLEIGKFTRDCMHTYPTHMSEDRKIDGVIAISFVENEQGDFYEYNSR